MADAIVSVLPFAIGIALSPIPIVAIIVILFTPLARSNGPAFAAGWAFSLLSVAGATLLLADSGDVATDESASDAGYVVRLVAGALLAILALTTWRGRPTGDESKGMPRWMEAVDSFTPLKSFGMGVLLGLNPKALVLAIGAALAIAQKGLGDAESWITLIVFVGAASASVAGIVLYYVLAGTSAEERLNSIKVWMIQHNAAVMARILLVLGVILIVQGALGLT
jgi:hypothetical protein